MAGRGVAAAGGGVAVCWALVPVTAWDAGVCACDTRAVIRRVNVSLKDIWNTPWQADGRGHIVADYNYNGWARRIEGELLSNSQMSGGHARLCYSANR